MKGWEVFTPAERRLAVLLFALAGLGQIARWGGRASPEVAHWLEGDLAKRPDTTLSAPLPPVRSSPSIRDTSSEALGSPAKREPPDVSAFAIDPNTADLATLMRLPGVGPVLAQRILEDRTQAGPYAKPEDLLRVPGIGPAKLAKLRPHLVFASRHGG